MFEDCYFNNFDRKRLCIKVIRPHHKCHVGLHPGYRGIKFLGVFSGIKLRDMKGKSRYGGPLMTSKNITSHSGWWF